MMQKIGRSIIQVLLLSVAILISGPTTMSLKRKTIRNNTEWLWLVARN